MSRNYDPFFKGTEAHRRNARWFAELWARFGYTAGVHLRRMHYQVLATGQRTATGEPYENTEGCFHDLCVAGSEARILGLVDPEAFDDRRNPPAHLHIQPREHAPEPAAGWMPPWWELPALDPDALSDQIDFELAGPAITGYDYHPDDQPVLLEVWIEKTTMDDVLVPLCRELRANLVRAAGFESITAVVGLLRRAERHGKPAHVLYASDFDPAGAIMPVAVARQAEFWREQLGIDVELTIEQVALTASQVTAYDLPHVPIKESDRRKARFEARNGQGAVELEALHSGVLAETVLHAIQPYVDPDLERRAGRTRWNAEGLLRSKWERATGQVRADLEALEDEVAGIVGRYRSQLEQIADRLDTDLAPYRERLERLGAEAERIARETVGEIELPPRPAPAEPDVDRSRLLFDSERHWWEQYRAFKTWQGKDAS